MASNAKTPPIRNEVLMRLLVSAILSILLVHTAHAASTQTSAPFDQRGVIVDVHTFFKSAAADRDPVAASEDGVADRALVTAAGVYAFLETPENQAQLADTGPGSVVHIKGKLLKKGALLHIDALEKTSWISLDLDLASLRNEPGQTIALKGTNKCQCGLDVADLPHSCRLGHLHHLEAADGKIYHYLQFAQGKDTFLGHGSHSKDVKVEGRVFPGQFLLVDKVKVN